jgi:hypothetical protein
MRSPSSKPNKNWLKKKPPNTHVKKLSDGNFWFLCDECDCPMLPIGDEKKENEYDHARGCQLDK